MFYVTRVYEYLLGAKFIYDTLVNKSHDSPQLYFKRAEYKEKTTFTGSR